MFSYKLIQHWTKSACPCIDHPTFQNARQQAGSRHDLDDGTQGQGADRYHSKQRCHVYITHTHKCRLTVYSNKSENTISNLAENTPYFYGFVREVCVFFPLSS
jgi:hypothetical protein